MFFFAMLPLPKEYAKKVVWSELREGCQVGCGLMTQAAGVEESRVAKLRVATFHRMICAQQGGQKGCVFALLRAHHAHNPMTEAHKSYTAVWKWREHTSEVTTIQLFLNTNMY